MKQPTPPKCVHGIWFTEDDLAGAIFCNSTVTTTGQCTQQEARLAARMMLAVPQLLAALIAIDTWAAMIHGYTPETADMFRKARAAIDKATATEEATA